MGDKTDKYRLEYLLALLPSDLTSNMTSLTLFKGEVLYQPEHAVAPLPNILGQTVGSLTVVELFRLSRQLAFLEENPAVVQVQTAPPPGLLRIASDITALSMTHQSRYISRVTKQ